ncbi:MAG: T9SS type A sorting domain-containing protein, partial [Bacteroidota bacterium]
ISLTDVGNNTTTETATVTVIDNLAPIALCKDRTVQLDGNGMLNLNPFGFDDGSIDNCGIASYSLDRPTLTCDDIDNNTRVQLIVTDNYNNTSSCEAKVTIEQGDGLPSGFSTASMGTSTGDTTFQVCDDKLYLTSTQTAAYDFKDGWGQIAYVNLSGDFSFSTELLSLSSNGVAGVMVRESTGSNATMSFVGKHGYGMTGGVNFNGNGYVMRKGNSRASRKIVFTVERVGNVITFKQGRSLLLRVNVDMGSSVMVGVFLSSTNTSEASATFGSISYSSTSAIATSGFTASDKPETQFEEKITELQAFPNPTTGLLNIVVDEFIGNTAILNVYNMTGQIVMTHNLGIVYEPKQQIDLSGLETGMYIISLESAGRLVQQKVVKE